MLNNKNKFNLRNILFDGDPDELLLAGEKLEVVCI